MTEYSYNTTDYSDFIGQFINYHYSLMCFRPIRLSNIRLPIGIMLSRLIMYHDNLADWTFSLLSHILMSNHSLTSQDWTLHAAYSAKSPIFPDFTTILDLLPHSLACKVQSSTPSYSILTSTCLFTTPASNPPPQLHRILHSTCQSTAQKSSVRMKSGDYTTCFQTVAKTPALSKLGQLA